LRPIRYEYEDVFDLPSTRRAGQEINRGRLLYFEVRYRNLSQVDFYGLGHDSAHSSLSDFEQRDVSLVAVTGYQFSRIFRFAVRTGYTGFGIRGGSDENELDISDLFTDESAPGLTQQPDFFQISPAALFDFRDVPENPHSGGAAGVSVTRFQPREGSFAFSRYLFDARYFVPLGNTSRVAAFWFHSSFDRSDSSNRVPFYLQQTLGGSQMLRGYDNFRFRDTNLVYVSAEYRWEFKPTMEIAGFFDAGKVFSDAADFGFTNLKNSYGVGFRIKTDGGVIFRVDFAHSAEENRLVLRFGPTF
jgi:outer membrane protein assembly factor BamA